VAILDRGRLLRWGSLAELLRSAGAQQSYALEVAGADERKLQEGLARRLGPERVRVRTGRPFVLELVIGDDDAALADALRYILDHGGVLRRCEPVERSLADVFRETVRAGDARGDASRAGVADAGDARGDASRAGGAGAGDARGDVSRAGGAPPERRAP
jgi:hypothetical protein